MLVLSRPTRVCFQLGFVLAIAAALWVLRQTASVIQNPPLPPPLQKPLDFGTVLERCKNWDWLYGKCPEQVEAVLGAPSPGTGWYGDFMAWEEEHGYSSRWRLGHPRAWSV